MPMFDIIIPHYGVEPRLELLGRECLKSIIRHSVDYRIILVDNASPRPRMVWETLYKCRSYTLIRNSVNLGFVQAVNQGIAMATAPYVVIMNNDTEAVPGWLDSLRSGLELASEVAASGPKTTCKSWQGRTPWTGAPRIIPKDGMLAFFCTMFKRSAMEKVGYLDEAFGAGLGDDSDYCRRLHIAGYRLAFVPDLIIPHKHRSTFNAVFGHDKVVELQNQALERFNQKWPTL